jgi:hypothetical protein
VEQLLNPKSQPAIDDDLMLRYTPSYNQAAAIEVNVQEWVYRMINAAPAAGKDGPVLAHDLLHRSQQD